MTNGIRNDNNISCHHLLPVLADRDGKLGDPINGEQYNVTSESTLSTVRPDSFIRSSVENDIQHKEERERNRKPTIYRYEFTDEFMQNLSRFSKIHQYDDRHIFKESWELWIQENSEIVNNEIIRLQSLNYHGDILDKMFKSARYYFRKKGTEKKVHKERKNYISFSKNILDCIDKHISINIQSRVKPSISFVDFCENNKEVVRETIQYLNKEGIRDLEEIQNKVKKTYKNRYFIEKTRLLEVEKNLEKNI